MVCAMSLDVLLFTLHAVLIVSIVSWLFVGYEGLLANTFFIFVTNLYRSVYGVAVDIPFYTMPYAGNNSAIF